jgi:hypothetical protein
VPRPRPPTSSSSTPAPCARTPTTSSTATSASCARPRPQPRPADRRRWLHGPEGPRQHRQARALGRRRLRHPQHRQPARPARPGPAQQARRGRDPRVLETFPSTLPTRRDSAYAGVGLDQRRLQQHVHLLHRPQPARQGAGPPPGRDPRRDRGPRRRRASSRSPCSGRTSTPTASSSATGSPSASCCAPAATSRAWSGCASPAPTRPRSPTTSSRRWPQTPNVMPSLHMPLQSGSDRCSRRCAARTAASASSASSTRSAPRSRMPRSPPTSSSASPVRPRRTSRRRCASSRRRASPAPSPSSTPSAPAPRGDDADQVPKAVVQERFDRLIALQDEISWAENRTLEGREVEVLVAPGEGRKDGETARLSGRARDNRLVHFALSVRDRGGHLRGPHHLVADSGVQGGAYSVRRTRGDAWASLQDGTRQAGRLPGDAVARQALTSPTAHPARPERPTRAREPRRRRPRQQGRGPAPGLLAAGKP